VVTLGRRNQEGDGAFGEYVVAADALELTAPIEAENLSDRADGHIDLVIRHHNDRDRITVKVDRPLGLWDGKLLISHTLLLLQACYGCINRGCNNHGASSAERPCSTPPTRTKPDVAPRARVESIALVSRP
jgi:hypothetical protein